MKNYIKKIGAIVLCFAMCISTFCLFTVSSTAAEENAVSKEYPVSDDMYIRLDGNRGDAWQGSGSNTYEVLNSGSHGTKFDRYKDTNVLNVKYYDASNNSNDRYIRTLLKFDLPTADQANGVNKVELKFTIARIADFASGNQTYNFYYATNVDWSETNVSWNGIINSIPDDEAHLLTTFDIAKGVDYTWKSNEDATVSLDITDLYLSLLGDNAQTLTVSIAAVNSLETTLQIHDKTSLGGGYGAKIVTSAIDDDALEALIAECDELITRYCSQESIEAFETVLEAAKNAVGNKDAIAGAYTALLDAKDALEFTKDYVVAQDAHIRSRSDVAKNNYNTTLVEAKYRPNNDLIGFMDIKLPTKADVKEFNFDTYEFAFNIGKSNDASHEYGFYFLTGIDWKESETTWEKSRGLFPADFSTLTPEFVYYSPSKGDATSADAESTKIVFDVTDTVKELIENGAEKVTVVIYGLSNREASIGIHSATTGNQPNDTGKAPKLIASSHAKAPVTTNETLKVESGDYDMHYQTRDGADGTTDYRLLVVANEDYIKTLESAKIQAVFSNGTVSKTLKVEITVAYTTIEAVDEDGNTTIYTAEDGTVIMGCVVKGVPAGYDIVKDSAEFLPVLAAN